MVVFKQIVLFPVVSLTSTLNNILSNPLAAFLHAILKSTVQQRIDIMIPVKQCAKLGFHLK